MRPLGVRLKLTVWFVGVLLVVLAIYSTWIGVLLWRNLAEALEHHLDEDYQVALQMIERQGGAIVWRGAPDADPGYEGGVRRWVEVWTEGDLLLFHRGSPDAEALQPLLPLPVPSPTAYIVPTPGGRVRVIARRHTLDGLPVVVRVARTERSEWVDLKPTLLALALGIPLALIVAGVGGHVLARRVLAPVGEMAERAHLISAERLHERLPVQHPHDEFGRLATVFNDTFARLERSFGALQRFTADASHELRTPLTALRTVGEVGLSEPRTAAEYQEIIGSMLEESDRLVRLIDGLLLLSRADGGRSRLNPELVDLGSKVRDIAAQLQVLAEEKGQSIVVEADGSVPALVDRTVCRHAIVNLLDNAIKYGPPDSRVVARVRQEAGSVVVEVSDDGPGVPPEHREHIFERFYRVGRERGDAGGSGLGLSIARWAVELHGGRIEYVPGVSSGSCFRITLPGPPTPA